MTETNETNETAKKIMISIRLTPEMHATIQAIADEQTRSVQLQITHFLKRCLEEEGKQPR